MLLWTHKTEHYNLQWCSNPDSHFILKMETANISNMMGKLAHNNTVLPSNNENRCLSKTVLQS